MANDEDHVFCPYCKAENLVGLANCTMCKTIFTSEVIDTNKADAFLDSCIESTCAKIQLRLVVQFNRGSKSTDGQKKKESPQETIQ